MGIYLPLFFSHSGQTFYQRAGLAHEKKMQKMAAADNPPLLAIQALPPAFYEFSISWGLRNFKNTVYLCRHASMFLAGIQ
ncbi:MAG: hypothetical protein HY885_00775 [Deltaproteobacteria bacterium]|nr:hypothetical protein [Deltaproteobacteria bacterium]